MCGTADDFALYKDDFHALTCRRTGRCVTSRTTTDDDQFLLRVHVVEVTGTDVVVLDVVVDEVVELVLVVDVVVVVLVVVVPKVGTVVGGTGTLLGQ